MQRLLHTAARGLMLALALNVALAAPAHAGVNAELNTFFNQMGGAANVTGPSAYQGQSAGYYTGGSLWTRFPQASVNPVNLQLPNVKAGCGGIDLFGGSFSFINSDELIALLKATASNALGFAFMLAIKSISPQIASTLEDLSQKVQQLNQFNMNSCEMAQNLVSGLWGKQAGREAEICKYIGNSQGIFSDWAKSRHECNEGGARASTLAANSDPTIPADSYNYTWDMLKKSYPTFDQDFREYLMTLVGTVIYVKAQSDAGNPSYRYLGQGDRAILTALLDGGSGAKVLRCDSADRCLNPVLGTLSIDPGQALKPRIRALLESMNAKVRSNTALTTQEIGLLGATSIPLYKIVTVNAAAQLGGMSSSDMDNLAEIVGVDMLETLVRQFYNLVNQGQASFHNADAETLGQWREQLRQVSLAMDSESNGLNARLTRMQVVLDRTVFLERTLRNSLSPQMSAALNFSRGLSAQGLQ
ncbi:MAG: pilus assembly protein [Novosphingobium sp. 17-62-19]|uniref:conjugal transfer protein TraH n=1 Tax=Novosphingobium sp. 17-62-19 TaxID=1970406 RepID=UPI000BD07121|nr:conjugal transfer protein TraH [Novosphingobium sp. 17-62-19]OYX95080.1 MAG: pilus assembly protein [Novosphingobium sp. 35-62-5]OZA19943.1 MAG: pilus assembly protein [Novosphingobium sp. 17-62-19]HQS96177.1 conjugal transfer protein TraH [Novosphingobium sp.]